MRVLIILALILAGALIAAAFLSACQAPQVCKHCWVGGTKGNA